MPGCVGMSRFRFRYTLLLLLFFFSLFLARRLLFTISSYIYIHTLLLCTTIIYCTPRLCSARCSYGAYIYLLYTWRSSFVRARNLFLIGTKCVYARRGVNGPKRRRWRRRWTRPPDTRTVMSTGPDAPDVLSLSVTDVLASNRPPPHRHRVAVVCRSRVIPVTI